MNIINKIKLIYLIILFSIIIGAVIPGLICYSGGFFYEEQMRSKIDLHKSNIDYNQHHYEAIDNRIKFLKLRILSDVDLSESREIIDVIRYLAIERDKIKNLTKISPFYMNPTMLIWPVSYACLGILIYLTLPLEYYKTLNDRLISYRHNATLAMFVYLYYDWPIWMRNFALSNEGRNIYSWANYDIWKTGFFIQEAQIFIFCFLLAVLLRKWFMYMTYRQEELYNEKTSSLEYTLDPHKAERLSLTFSHWQISSFLLACCFICSTATFWTFIFNYGDKRYLLHAIMVHILWLASWAILSIPLVITWYYWNTNRVKALAELEKHAHKNGEYTKLIIEIIEKINPIGFLNTITTALASIMSLFLPIIQALIR